MRPIYMPFTHISEKVACCIYNLLGPAILYQSGGLPVPFGLDKLAEKGLIKIHNPIEIIQEDTLAGLKHDFHVWASQQLDHSRIDPSAFRAFFDVNPFYEENSSAQIRTEINQLRRGEPLCSSKNSILIARLFLALAQEYDAKKIDLVRDLDTVVDMEENLLKNLKGDTEEKLHFSPLHKSAAEDAGAYMTRERIDSWSLFYLADKKPADIFVTESRAVMEQLCETWQDLIMVPGMATLMQKKSDWNNHHNDIEKIQNIIIQLGRSDAPLMLIEKWSSGANRKERYYDKWEPWSLYFAPGVSPDTFWERYGCSVSDKKININKNQDPLNTLIFHLEC